jgi:hypothetical protein
MANSYSACIKKKKSLFTYFSVFLFDFVKTNINTQVSFIDIARLT